MLKNTQFRLVFILPRLTVLFSTRVFWIFPTTEPLFLVGDIRFDTHKSGNRPKKIFHRFRSAKTCDQCSLIWKRNIFYGKIIVLSEFGFEHSVFIWVQNSNKIFRMFHWMLCRCYCVFGSARVPNVFKPLCMPLVENYLFLLKFSENRYDMIGSLQFWIVYKSVSEMRWKVCENK